MSMPGLDIRPFAAGDAPALHAAIRASIASLSRLFPWCSADYSMADAEARVAACIAAWRDGSEAPFGIFERDSREHDDGDAGGARQRLLGCVGLNRFDRIARSANLGYWTGEAHRGRGIATQAAAWAAAYGFRELGLARIEIVVLPDNAASLRVAGKLGAVREGIVPGRITLGDGPLQGRPADAVLFSLSPEPSA
jgi:RimJ/RimL family protein N-acetyltransferase